MLNILTIVVGFSLGAGLATIFLAGVIKIFNKNL